MTNPTETILALEKALEDVRKWHKMKAPTVDGRLDLLRAQRDSLRDFETACSPLAIRTLLDAHASALRGAERYRWLVIGKRMRQGAALPNTGTRLLSKSETIALMSFNYWCTPEELSEAIDVARSALDDNTKGASHG